MKDIVERKLNCAPDSQRSLRLPRVTVLSLLWAGLAAACGDGVLLGLDAPSSGNGPTDNANKTVIPTDVDNSNDTGDTAFAAEDAASQGNGSTTWACVSMDTLYPLSPKPLQAQWQNIKKAALSAGLQPQLLVAIAMQESTGGSDQSAYANGGGMFQFTNEATWQLYGHGGDRLNDADSVAGAARYLAALLKEQGTLAAALAEYSGNTGGYAQNVKQLMMGDFSSRL